MPANIVPGSLVSYNFLGIAMPCPDQYYYKPGQVEVQFYNRQFGYLGLPEFTVVWNSVNSSFAKAAIEKFNEELENGSWHDFKMISPYGCEWVDARGVLRKPMLAGIKGKLVLGFTLHFTSIGGQDLVTSPSEGNYGEFRYGNYT